VLIRGDLSVNETKLENYFKKKIRPASPETLKKAGLVRGYISPVNLSEDIKLSFIADHSIKHIKNFVTGANEFAVDYINVNLARDFIVADFTDLVEVKNGFTCVKCGGDLKEIKAVESANIFKLGTKFSDAFGFKVTGNDGALKPVIMGCYGIGTTRLLATIVETYNDEKGIIWPKSVAPYQVHLLNIGNDESVINECVKLYEELLDEGIEVLFDDRDERAGVKLNDADLIGVPVRIVLSKRTLENKSAEWKIRSETEALNVSISDLKEKIKEYLNS